MKKIMALVLLGLSLSACETVSYYSQAVTGQLYILTHGDRIHDLIADEDTSPQLKAKLARILEIRTFAEQSLGLPMKDNFATYVDLQRPFAVWNVFATPEFSMQPVNWCYPVAGCVSYRGYFSEAKAQNFARHLNIENYDVHVGGVAAYSTLGWFSDPVLNTVINLDDYKLASLIFHEMAHQVVYVPGDTRFNESFATAVELEGLKRWLAHSQRNEAQNALILRSVTEDMERRADFVSLVKGAVSELKLLYDSPLAEPLMREEKHAILSRLREDYAELKAHWGGYRGYDGWFAQELNNARLSTVATYFNWVPAFTALLEEERGSLPAFYARVQDLSRMQGQERQAMLEVFNVVESTELTTR